MVNTHLLLTLLTLLSIQVIIPSCAGQFSPPVEDEDVVLLEGVVLRPLTVGEFFSELSLTLCLFRAPVGFIVGVLADIFVRAWKTAKSAAISCLILTTSRSPATVLLKLVVKVLVAAVLLAATEIHWLNFKNEEEEREQHSLTDIFLCISLRTIVLAVHKDKKRRCGGDRHDPSHQQQHDAGIFITSTITSTTTITSSSTMNLCNYINFNNKILLI